EQATGMPEATGLTLVQRAQQLTARNRRRHLRLQSRFVVLLPRWIVRVRRVPDQHVAFDPHFGCLQQHHTVRLSLAGLKLAGKSPRRPSLRAEVSALHPVSRLATMTPS